ncbi:MAG: sodium:calcium antiporter [Alphaproteobacteria bacterium]|nr:MAG: sodium:calcium antiporter [Alphaproteobacteria bacterium]
MLVYFQAAAGLAVLVIAGDLLVRGAVSLAARLRVSPLVISLTVVALGTSAPELVVGVQAALADVPALALGNVIGSNIANVFLVLGLPALIFPIRCDAHDLKFNLIHMLAATAIFSGLAFLGVIDRWQGLLFLGLLIAFLVQSGARARKGDTYAPDELADIEGVPDQPYSYPVAGVLVVLGLGGLALGADLLVDGATTIARTFGVSEEVIGLTLVAVGTSLPELVTAVMAAIHRHGDVAIGNVIGSNIFNIYGIIGATALIRPVPVSGTILTLDLWVMVAAALLIIPFVLRRGAISAPYGFLFLTAYGLYLWLLSTTASPVMESVL